MLRSHLRRRWRLLTAFAAAQLAPQAFFLLFGASVARGFPAPLDLEERNDRCVGISVRIRMAEQDLIELILGQIEWGSKNLDRSYPTCDLLALIDSPANELIGALVEILDSTTSSGPADLRIPTPPGEPLQKALQGEVEAICAAVTVPPPEIDSQFIGLVRARLDELRTMRAIQRTCDGRIR